MSGERAGGAIIVGGVPQVVDGALVWTWHETGLYFVPPFAPPRVDKARWIVVHWTASERSGEAGARQIHRSLKGRNLSVDFAITNEGTIWQYFDPAEQRGKHASRVNRHAIGIEVSCTGWKRRPDTAVGTAAKRRRYQARIHGWRSTFFDFFPAQQKALNALCAALVEALGIAPRVLTAPWERVPTLTYRSEQGGICGHLHAASLRARYPKVDPGTAPLEALDRFFRGLRAEP